MTMWRTTQAIIRPSCRINRYQVGRTIPTFTATAPGHQLGLPKRFSSFETMYRSYQHTNRLIWAMIAANVTVFGAWAYARQTQDRKALQTLYENASLSWANIEAGRYWTMITCMFSHVDGAHLFFNMFGMWTFGGIVARSGVGVMRAAGLIFGSGVAGSAAYLYENRDLARSGTGWKSRTNYQPRQRSATAMGASAAVMGLSGAAACLAPMTPMVMLIVPAPLWIWVFLYAGVDYYYLGQEGSRIGHSAHLGGVGFGLLFYAASLRRFGGILKSTPRLR